MTRHYSLRKEEHTMELGSAKYVGNYMIAYKFNVCIKIYVKIR